ncbi:hypothetical protein Droror1_Dr00000978 [Drosera rotundifolia]
MMCAIHLVLLEGGYFWMQNPRCCRGLSKSVATSRLGREGNAETEMLIEDLATELEAKGADDIERCRICSAIEELARESDVEGADGFISWAGQRNQGLCKKHAEHDMLIEELVMELDGN